MTLDDETLEALGWGDAGLDLAAMTVVPRAVKSPSTPQAKPPTNLKARKRHESEYQKAYAQTPHGKARRYAAKVAYRRRQRLALRKAAPDAASDTVSRYNAHSEAM